jgi:hypothetical protein
MPYMFEFAMMLLLTFLSGLPGLLVIKRFLSWRAIGGLSSLLIVLTLGMFSLIDYFGFVSPPVIFFCGGLLYATAIVNCARRKFERDISDEG